MDGDKQVSLVLVGNVGTGMQRDKDIRLTGIDDLHIRAVLLYQLAEGQRHIQIDGFLLGNLSNSSCVIAAMAGINDQRKTLIGSKGDCCHTQE